MPGKIVLFRPRLNKNGKEPLVTPLSLLAISAPLERQGYQVKIIDAMIDPGYEQKIISEARGAICLGITAITGYQIFDAVKTARAVKKIYQDLPIVWGGWHPTVTPRQTIQHECVDVVVNGLGEVTFKELVYSLEQNIGLERVKGILFKKSGKIVENIPRPLNDIEFLPLPYHLLDVEKYIRTSYMGRRTLDYRSCYGCPFSCHYCADSLMSQRKWLANTSQKVLDEMEDLVNRYNVDALLLLENNFFVDKKRVEEICRGIVERNLSLRFGSVSVRPEQFHNYDGRLIELIHKAGFQQLLVGTESGSQEILDFINKQAKVEDTIRLKELCRPYGIELQISILVGLPLEEMDIKYQIREAIKLIRRLQKIDYNQNFYFSIYIPYPGTKLFDLSLKLGLKEPKTLEDWAEIDATKVRTPWVPKRYEIIVKQLNEYIFPYISRQFAVDWENIYHGRLRWLKRMGHKLFCFLARLRLKHEFFALPIDYKILLLFKKLSNKNASKKIL